MFIIIIIINFFILGLCHEATVYVLRCSMILLQVICYVSRKCLIRRGNMVVLISDHDIWNRTVEKK